MTALIIKTVLLAACPVVLAGCALGKSESFTFTTDMPPGFTYEAVAQYVPAKGETCTVKKPNVGYNQRWRCFTERHTRKTCKFLSIEPLKAVVW